MSALISLSHVGKTYTARNRTISALRDINLEISKGEIFAVIGQSGAGKSTLVRLINGLERPTDGRVLVDGADVGQLRGKELARLRQRIGMIFQHFNLLSSRTVAGNVGLPLQIARMSKEERDRRVAQALDFVGLLERAHDYPEQLSGGQKQRVGIARALAAEPTILLADESTSALDPQTTEEVLALLKKVNRELGVTIVVITHEMDVVRRIADRVAVLDRGEVAEIGSTFDVFTTPKHPLTVRLAASLIQSRPDEEVLAQLRNRHHGTLALATVVDVPRFQQELARLAGAGTEVGIVHGGYDTIQGREFGKLSLALPADDGPEGHLSATLNALSRHAELEVIR